MLYAPYGAVTEQKFATMARKFVPENLLTIKLFENFLGNLWKFLFRAQGA